MRTAPFTDDEVRSLNDYQASGVFHPFTCGRRGDSPHRDFDIDTGVLLATNQGWVCRDCDYTQDWAHVWMADGSWREAGAPVLDVFKSAREKGAR